jgi:acetamidase/formamidase
MAHRHLAAGPDTVRWGYWDSSLPPVLSVRSGDTMTVETLSGEPEDMPAPELGFEILDAHRAVHQKGDRGPGPHFLTGPIHVEGAEPGDALEVAFETIELLQDWGWNLQAPLLGTLPDDFPDLRRLHIPLDRDRMVARLHWGQELPLKPFFGVVGVAPPPAWGRLTSVLPRAFGGNMDNKELSAGSILYLPVFNDGALLSIGDGHAAQGDGEVCLTAIETCMRGTLRLTVRKGLRLDLPRAETPDAWITMGFDEDLDDAAKQALREMIKLIGELTGLSRQDAYTLCSLAADLRVTQTVDVNKGIHCVLRKEHFPARRRDPTRPSGENLQASF